MNWTIEDIYTNLGNGNEKSSDLHQLFKNFFNGQTRMILDPHIPTHNFVYSSEDALDIDYDNKLHNILDNYYTIGLQEYYNESVDMFSQVFGWRKLVYSKENITKFKPKVSELSDDTISLIRKYNQLDVKLHRKYSKQFR